MDKQHIPGPPAQIPIGLLVARVAKDLDRAFDDALTAAGGNRPTWLILLAVKTGAGRTQATIAEHVGISGPTLIHHLDRLVAGGIVARERDAADRRMQIVTLTAPGDQLFLQLRNAAIAFDAQLRSDLSDADITKLRQLLATLRANVRPATPAAPSTGSRKGPTT